MFPQTVVNTSEINTKATTQGKSFLFDFDTNNFVIKDGKLVEVEGIEAIKTWIAKILRTEKFKFNIYDEYGVKLEDLMVECMIKDS